MCGRIEPRYGRRVSRSARIADALLAGAMTLISVGLLAGLHGRPAVAWPLALAHTLPLALRRRYPVGSAAVAIGAALAYVVVGVPMIGLGPAALVWLYSVGSYAPRPSAYALLAGAEATVAVAIGVRGQSDAATWVTDAVALVVAYLLGDAWLVLGLPLGIAYGTAAYLVGVRVGGHMLDRRMPELLATVTPNR